MKSLFEYAASCASWCERRPLLSAVLLTALVTSLRAILHPLLFNVSLYTLFFFSTALSASFGGLAAGILAALLGGLSGFCFFTLLGGDPDPFGFVAISQLSLFLLTSALIIVLAEWGRLQRQKLSRETEQSRRRASLIDLTPDAIIVRKLDGTITFWSKGAARLYGWTENETLGRSAPQLLKTQFPQPLEQILETVSRGESWGGELVRQTKDGQKIIVQSAWALEQTGSGPEILESNIDITGHKEAELSRIVDERRLRAFFESNIIGTVYWRSDGQILDANDKFLKMTGYSREDLRKGLSWQKITPPEYKQLDEHALDELRQSGASTPFGKEFLRTDGSRVPVIIGAATVDEARSEGVAFVLDITLRRKAEDALRASNERLEQALNASNSGTFDWDMRTGEIAWPAELLRIYGLASSNVEPGIEQWKKCLLPEDADWVTAAINRAMETGSYSTEFRIRRNDTGELRWIDARGRVFFDDQGKPLRMAGINTDVTERKESEARRIELERQLEQAHKLESIGILAGGIAHDFNNLLGGLFGFVDLAQINVNDGNLQEVSKNLVRAMDALGRARALTRQLLTFSKGGSPLKSTVDINQIILETLNFSLSGSNIVSETELPPYPLSVRADKHQLIQALENLIINARDAMPGGGTVRVTADMASDRPQIPQVLPDGAYVRIRVRDEGHGIPEEQMKHIFDPFFTTKEKGHGLGLSISHSVIKRHAGHIIAESILEKGSTFTVFLPVLEDAIRLDKERLMAKRRALVMEDEPTMAESTSSMLESLGYAVDVARRGEDAIAAFTATFRSGLRYNLIILDLTIRGGMGGEQTMLELRKIDPHVKVIASSGYSEHPVLAKPAKFGFAAALPKPYTRRELITIVSAVDPPENRVLSAI